MQAIRINDPSAEELLALEWLESFGNGGYASSSLSGANTRRYHGLYVSSRGDLDQRQVLLSRLDESAFFYGQHCELSTRLYRGALHPDSRSHLKEFERGLYPQWTYVLRDDKGELLLALRKSVLSLKHLSALLITYDLLDGPEELQLELRPFVAGRGIHELLSPAPSPSEAFFSSANNSLAELLLNCSNNESCAIYGNFKNFLTEANVHHDFFYPRDAERGFDHSESLTSPGVLQLSLLRGRPQKVLICEPSQASEIFSKPLADREAHEILRRKTISQSLRSTYSEVGQLLLAADQFICRDNNDIPQVIAGFPWFGIWGRDSLIALPGLLLTPQHYTKAKQNLEFWISELKDGLLPNRVVSISSQANPMASLGKEGREYNSIDATLWLFVALHYYLEESGDKEFLTPVLLEKLQESLGQLARCSHFGVREDPDDSLLLAGEGNWQLTWMDARLDGVPVTPRHGKAVEINALWYNAHRILADFALLCDSKETAKTLHIKSDRIKKSFCQKFPILEAGSFLHLADYIERDGRQNLDFRPNQVFALSLPYPLLEGERAEIMMDKVFTKLYTPRGLRTLEPEHPDFHAHYVGGIRERDAAYHQGTAWAWLLGPYFRAGRRFGSPRLRKELPSQFEDCLGMLREGCIGSVAEVFDAVSPKGHPRACYSQAWSVAELLRVAHKDLGFAMTDELEEKTGFFARIWRRFRV